MAETLESYCSARPEPASPAATCWPMLAPLAEGAGRRTAGSAALGGGGVPAAGGAARLARIVRTAGGDAQGLPDADQRVRAQVVGLDDGRDAGVVPQREGGDGVPGPDRVQHRGLRGTLGGCRLRR